MGKNSLETVGDGSTLRIGMAGTLGLAGAVCGTITSAGVLTGVFGDEVLAAANFSTSDYSLTLYDMNPNEIDAKKVDNTKLSAKAFTSQPGTPDYGEVGATIAYDIVISQSLNAFIKAKTMLLVALTNDDYSVTDSAEVFLGWIMKLTPLGGEHKKDETAKVKVTVCISGVPLIVAGA